ncbi:MAG: hypothetical protein KY476_19035 [Planctomycetes bacterium]|nr:hypothetical protein [Planctomycetota bacterium]
MVRNLLVTGVVSLVMGVTTLALQSIAPVAAQPTMEGRAADSLAGPMPAGADALASQAPMADQRPLAEQGPIEGQIAASSAAPQTAAAMAGGGSMPAGMMMCPCMQMMMGGGAGGMTGSGMMGGGMTGGPMSQAGSTAQPFSNPRTTEQARAQAERYLQSLGNPHLKAGEVRETAASFEIQVLTQEDSLANWIVIDKQSGQMRTLY